MERLTLDKFPAALLERMDVETIFFISRAVIAAERLQLFRWMAGRKATVQEIANELAVQPRYLRVLLDVLASSGLLEKDQIHYWMSPLAEKHFVQGRSIHWTRQYSKECLDAYQALTVLEDMLVTGKPHWQLRAIAKDDYLISMQHDPEQARDFTHMLYHHHQEDARALAARVDLTSHQSILDVGGGSGIMSIHLLRRFPHLRSTILDIPPVCRIAEEIIQSAGLSHRISTFPGDIHGDLPTDFDIVLCADITSELSPELLRRFFDHLPDRGMLLVVDRFMNEENTEPQDRLVFQFLDGFSSASAAATERMLASSGFESIVCASLCRDVCVVSGVKRRQSEDLGRSAEMRPRG